MKTAYNVLFLVLGGANLIIGWLIVFGVDNPSQHDIAVAAFFGLSLALLAQVRR